MVCFGRFNSFVFVLFCMLPSFLIPGTSFSSNFHEHFTTVASYRDYVTSLGELGIPLEHLKLRELSADPVAAVALIFGVASSKVISPEMEFQFAATAIATVLSGEGLRRVKSREVMRSFFEFTPLNRHDISSTEIIGFDIRSTVQRMIADRENGILYLFKSYLKHTTLDDRRTLSLAVPARNFFDPKQFEVLKRLKTVFSESGTRSEYFLVQQRQRFIAWSDEEFGHFMDQLRTALATGLVDGFDLVGSLHEAEPGSMDIPERQQSLLYARLVQLLTLFSETGFEKIQLRLHAWEVPNTAQAVSGGRFASEGDFYKILHQLFEKTIQDKSAVRFPRVVRIGHIAGIRDPDIAAFVRLGRLSGTRFIFEANVVSNVATHGADIRELAKTIEKLESAGLAVVLGSDAQGILGEESRFRATLSALKRAGLSERVLIALQLRALAPGLDGCESALTVN